MQPRLLPPPLLHSRAPLRPPMSHLLSRSLNTAPAKRSSSSSSHQGRRAPPMISQSLSQLWTRIALLSSPKDAPLHLPLRYDLVGSYLFCAVAWVSWSFCMHQRWSCPPFALVRQHGACLIHRIRSAYYQVIGNDWETPMDPRCTLTVQSQLPSLCFIPFSSRHCWHAGGTEKGQWPAVPCTSTVRSYDFC